MTDNQRLFYAYEYLKRKGRIKTYSDLADVLGINKSELTNLKSGKMDVGINHIRSLVSVYPELSLNWLILSKGGVEIEQNISSEFDISLELLKMQKQKIQELEKSILELKQSIK
ncbi:hypothetical protein [Flavobacterium sp.]|uniref:hypothetical protein n=1 Tax=Flavobacterium sp. TaxID=239 RepID=UPI002616F26A|nr:hypothetical protein [Flavobacterium sp.]MDD2986124.1 hypothetical protein [Flavobacterium sp.]